MDQNPGNHPAVQAIYIHIPFCIQKCHYCDFVSYPIGDLPVEEYCHAVMAEAALYSRQINSFNNRIKSIYIGGGTPTSVPAEYLIKILDQVRTFFPVKTGGEITVECNPKTVDQEYFLQLKKAGVTRISIGAQAFQDQLLSSMGRVHHKIDIEKAVADAKWSGFSNINLDLIYALPGQTLGHWKFSLRAAAALSVPHIAVYGLKLGENSLWGQELEKGFLKVPDQDASADMFDYAIDYLQEQGYQQYEISNFALPGYFSVHNRVYWNNGNYLGLGVAASSHWGHVRQTNHASLARYISDVKKGKFPVWERETADLETEMAETVFLGLRLMEGINMDEFEKNFGVKLTEKYQNQVEKFCRLGLLEYGENRLKLTRKGIFLANEVFVEFLP